MTVTLILGLALAGATVAFLAYGILVPSPFRRPFPADCEVRLDHIYDAETGKMVDRGPLPSTSNRPT